MPASIRNARNPLENRERDQGTSSRISESPRPEGEDVGEGER